MKSVTKGFTLLATALLLVLVGCNTTPPPSYRQAPPVAGVSFKPGVTYAKVGASPYHVITGDFNGDGHLDVAIADQNNEGSIKPGRITVMINKGGGAFKSPVLYKTATEAYFVATGDLNGDGHLDLVAACVGNGGSDPGAISVLLGKGDGTFAAAANYPAGTAPEAVAIGDISGDGYPDIVVGNQLNHSPLTILLNNGKGAFPTKDVKAVGRDPKAIALADFDKDGHLDIAVAELGGGNVAILLNKGGGAITDAVYYNSVPAWDIVSGDFNGDGYPDLAVGGRNVFILWNDKAGTFAAPDKTGVNGTHVTAADFDGDGDLDLAVNSFPEITLLLNQGGLFVAQDQKIENSIATDLAAGDFNGDSAPDVATIQYFPDSLEVFMNQVRFPYQVGQIPNAVATGDFNGDDILDLVTANAGATAAGGNSILLGQGDGSFTSGTPLSSGPSPRAVVTGDFNGDGFTDVVTVFIDGAKAGVATSLGNGDGTFKQAGNPRLFSGPSVPSTMTTADFNGDGKLDLAIAIPNKGVAVLLGGGDGTFSAPSYFITGSSPVSVATADFNGDGNLDLVTSNYYDTNQNGNSVLLGGGDGTFKPQMPVPSGPKSTAVTTADVNGDGHTDIITAFEGSSSWAKGIFVNLGNGDGAFHQTGKPQPFTAKGKPIAIATGDFNGDGKVDLVTANDDGTASLLLGKGDGFFDPHLTVPAGAHPTAVVVGDFDGNQLPDFAVADSGSNTVSVLLHLR